MKHKARINKLQARIKQWEQLPKGIQSAYTKPGSLNK